MCDDVIKCFGKLIRYGLIILVAYGVLSLTAGILFVSLL